MQELDPLSRAITVLRNIFLVLYIAAAIIQFVLGEVDIFPMILGILIYCLLGGERMVSHGYRVMIVLELLCCLYLIIKLLYLILDDHEEGSKVTRKIVTIVANLTLFLFGIILTWRNYEATKLNEIMARDFVVI